MNRLDHGMKRILFLDNASGHKITEQVAEELKRSNTEISFA